MKYHYIARNPTGSIERGIIEATTEEIAIEILQRRGLTVTLLRTITEEKATQKEIRILPRRVRAKDLVFFMRQLSILISSNVPIVEALHVLSVQASNSLLCEQTEEIANDVNGGMFLSEALSKHPLTFSPFVVNMVKVGEVGGNLPKVLEYLAEHQEKEYVLMAKIRGALLYPVLILATCIGVLTIMIVFVLPRISTMFKEFEAKLPLITKIMLNLGDFLSKFFWVFILIFAVGVYLFYRYIKTSSGKAKKDKVELKLPIIGEILKNVYYARMCENLGTLIKGGIPIVQALDTVSIVIGNTLFKDVLQKAKDSVRRGEGISPVFAQSKEIIAPSLTQMIDNGEKSGKIEKVLLDLSNFYNGEVTRAVDNFMTILEPILLIGIGGIVLLVAIGVILPIYSLVSAIH